MILRNISLDDEIEFIELSLPSYFGETVPEFPFLSNIFTSDGMIETLWLFSCHVLALLGILTCANLVGY